MLKKIHLPMSGLALGLAALGNLLQSHSEFLRGLCGVLAAIVFILVTVKMFSSWSGFMAEMENPVISSVYATYPMALMLLAGYVKPFLGGVATVLWYVAIIAQFVLYAWFALKFVFNFDIRKVFPSWFIVYVGAVVASVTAPAFDALLLGQIIFWIGLVGLLILLPIVFYRVYKVGEIKPPVRPNLAIFTAPTALCLAGYMNSFPEKNMAMVWFLTLLSQALYFFVLIQLPKMLQPKFLPSYSAFTFPLVISALSLKLANAQVFQAGSLKILVLVETVIATLAVFYVLYGYTRLMLAREN